MNLLAGLKNDYNDVKSRSLCLIFRGGMRCLIGVWESRWLMEPGLLPPGPAHAWFTVNTLRSQTYSGPIRYTVYVSNSVAVKQTSSNVPWQSVRDNHKCPKCQPQTVYFHETSYIECWAQQYNLNWDNIVKNQKDPKSWFFNFFIFYIIWKRSLIVDHLS